MNSKFFKKILILLSVILVLNYLIYRVLFTIPFEFGLLNVALGIIFIFCEFLSLFEFIITFIQADFDEKNSQYESIELKKYEMVDVVIATHNEDPELLYKVINGLKRQKYPSKYINIFLCDDGKVDRGMKELAKKMNIEYIKLKNNNEYKAGNLNNALKHTNSPYIVTVDADMIANENAIGVLVANIQKNPKLAFVQSPQSLYNLDRFRSNFHAENDFPDDQSFFFKIVNCYKSKSDSCIYCGSNAILRRSALESIGGFATYSITEDYATAVKLQRKGWKNKAIPKTLFNGLAPYTILELMKQRSRWCRGCFQTLINNRFFLTKDLTIKQICNNIATTIHWLNFFTRFIFLTLPFLIIFFGFIPVNITTTVMLAIWVPMCVLLMITINVISQNTRGLIYSEVIVTIQAFALTEAFIIGMINRKPTFDVTSKTKPLRLKHFSKFGIPHVIYLGISIIALIYYALIGAQFAIVLFWLVVNIFILTMSSLFFIEREDRYHEDVYPIEENILINSEKFTTKQISDRGLYIENYFNHDNSEIINIEISEKTYKGEVVNLGDDESLIKLKFSSDEEFQEYLFFVYNREDFFNSKTKINIFKVFFKAIKANLSYTFRMIKLKKVYNFLTSLFF